MGCNPLVLFIVRVTIAFIGVVVGIAAGLVFGITFNNLHAAGWAGVSSLFALISLVVIILVYKKKLKDWGLTLFALVGATGIVLASTAFFLYIVLGFYDKDSKLLVFDTSYLSLMCIIMTRLVRECPSNFNPLRGNSYPLYIHTSLVITPQNFLF